MKTSLKILNFFASLLLSNVNIFLIYLQNFEIQDGGPFKKRDIIFARQVSQVIARKDNGP